MIKFIVAIDEKKGMANEHGIPWQGKIPGDVKRFRDLTEHGNVLMGYKTYSEFNKPLSNRHNYVLTNSDEQLREGFEPVRDLEQFIKTFDGDLWVIGEPLYSSKRLPMPSSCILHSCRVISAVPNSSRLLKMNLNL